MWPSYAISRTFFCSYRVEELRLRYDIEQMGVDFLGVYLITIVSFYKVLASLKSGLKEY